MQQRGSMKGCQEICSLNQLKKEQTVGFVYRVDGEEQSAFVVFLDDEIYGYKNHCPHLGVELNWQPDQFLTFDGHSILCSMHGAQFRISDGFCHTGPCHGKSLQTVEVAICGENVIICPSDEGQ